MKNVMKLTVSALAVSGGMLVAAPAMAQTPTVSGNVTIVSDYRFRGVTLSDNSAALQGGIDLGWDSGFYIGTWGSSIDTSAFPAPSGNEFELDVYAGYGGEFGNGMGFDIGLLAYLYPGSEDFDDTYYFEPYASISGEAGAFGWTIGGAYAFDQDNLAQDNIYVYADTSIGLGESPVSLDLHLGYEDGAFGADKIDWGAGLSFATALGLGLGIQYGGFDQSGGDDDFVLAWVGYEF